ALHRTVIAGPLPRCQAGRAAVLDVWKDLIAPIAEAALDRRAFDLVRRVAEVVGEWECLIVVLNVHADRRADLPGIGQTAGLARLLSRLGEDGEENGSQDGNNG